MAVYTKISKEDLENFLSNYKIGKLKSFQGIVEGIENTIYLLVTSYGKYILTLYEKRVREEDLPFFMNLLSSLSEKKFKCPKPIKDRKENYITWDMMKNKLKLTPLFWVVDLEDVQKLILLFKQ